MPKHSSSGSMLVLPPAASHTAWNSTGRLAVALHNGTLQLWDPPHASPTIQWQAHFAPILKVVWAPPEFGFLLATCTADGCVSLWEELCSKDGGNECALVCQLQDKQTPVLDLEFGNCLSGLKIVIAGADGYIKIYETASSLELRKWQLQAEFPNVANLKEGTGRITCTSASISWRPPVNSTQRPVFALGYCTSSQHFSATKVRRAVDRDGEFFFKNIWFTVDHLSINAWTLLVDGNLINRQVWEFTEAYQRWQMIAELRDSHEKPEPVHHISWAPNVGRPFELIAVASGKSVSIWRLEFPLDSLGRLVLTRSARLTEHSGEVFHMDWDMTGMTLATSGSDGTVRLWQSNFNGQWQQQGIVESFKDS